MIIFKNIKVKQTVKESERTDRQMILKTIFIFIVPALETSFPALNTWFLQ